ncbi:P-loop containing nucleoside triphosphate hydrolase protein [Pluteus cervinus]|uniref:P-loop containing nucleoside triphosphate hydrolase protein n=1 Tax=Pluteus cervinus TaxID=181527 RepID=A0ACD3BGF7_9AGAR|nr:P-loop containing nucleoside triphosphate hydrolase protein [Pluteus cervinus]
MAKKKKQLKPVARGYAVTSIPKKVEPPPENVEEPVEVENPNAGADQRPSVSSEQVEQTDSARDPLLQAKFENLQDKTDREISRTLKAIAVDRRESRHFQRVGLDQILLEAILNFALERGYLRKTKLATDAEDKLLGKLGVTYGVLRRLALPEENVTGCLQDINGVELEDAYDWLALHCTEEQLGMKADRPIAGGTPQETRSPNTPVQPPKPLPNPDPPILNPRAAIFVPTAPPTVDTSDSETDDPTARYIELKIRLTRLSRVPPPKDTLQIDNLKRELKKLELDPLLDRQEADDQFRIEVKKLDAQVLLDKLRSDKPPPSPSQKRDEKLLRKEAKASRTAALEPAQDDDGDELDGLANLLEVNAEHFTGSTITLRELPLPRSGSGRVPKTLLMDFVQRTDRHAIVDYECISGSSRARRVAVSVRWAGKPAGQWKMEDTACPQLDQAENYIAMIALHALAYPQLEGFPSNPSPPPVSVLTLPQGFRELWEELEANRRVRDSETNYSLWSHLNTIMASKVDQKVQISTRVDAQTLAQDHTSRRFADQLDESLQSAFFQRQASRGYQEMLVHRNTLPIAQYRDHIIDVLEHSNVLVLSGETGCGKSTQVPAFLLENYLSNGRPCKILCTEPRRISAISLAQRVSRELGDPPNTAGSSSSLVGYSIRLESKVSRSTRLIYATNGIALRMLESSSSPKAEELALNDLTHIIIDEVHERTIESDFLLIVLKSLLQQRPELKVILMSATVEADKIAAYFSNCPTLQVPGRTFPVNVFYLEDAIEHSRWKIAENSPYAKRGFQQNKGAAIWTEEAGVDDDDDDAEDTKFAIEKRFSQDTRTTLNLLDERLIPYDLIIQLLEKICFEDAALHEFSSAVLVFMPGLAEIRRLHEALAAHRKFGVPDQFTIYPLHSTLSSEDQAVVFDTPPYGMRKIVIATNIAETGITIPDITCVIDTGKHREMRLVANMAQHNDLMRDRYDEKRQLSRLVETFIAKSNAAQRRGRAGRVQPGICFHLFTKHRHETRMADHPLPEMMRLSLADLALRIKIMKVNLGPSIGDVLSRALDPPTVVNVQRAVGMLVEVRALTSSEDLTPMGRLLSKLPTDVHLGKFLLIAAILRCLDPALTIAASLNSKGPFARPFGLEQQADQAKASFKTDNSDFLTIHNAFSSWRRAILRHDSPRQFCQTNFLSHQNLQQIEELRQQFLGYLLDSGFIRGDATLVQELNRARYAGRNRVRFVNVPPEYNDNANSTPLINAALIAGLYPRILVVNPEGNEIRTLSNSQPAFFHPSSVNHNRNVGDFGVDYLTYFTLMRSKRLYAWEVGPVDNLALLLLCGDTEFKLVSDSVAIDRKIRFHLTPKVGIALKALRGQFAGVLECYFSGKPLSDAQRSWYELGLAALSKAKYTPAAEPRTQIIQGTV